MYLIVTQNHFVNNTLWRTEIQSFHRSISYNGKINYGDDLDIELKSCRGCYVINFIGKNHANNEIRILFIVL
jgi:hypothetical protein